MSEEIKYPAGFHEYEDENAEIGWDDEIEQDGSEFTLLPDGDYDFQVTGFERQRFDPKEGSKVPPCNMAIISIKIDAPQGSTTIKYRLFMYKKNEWKISEFFIGIGQKKKGERVKMNWNTVIGSTGRCKIATRTYNDNQYNEIKKIYDSGESASLEPQTSFKGW